MTNTQTPDAVNLVHLLSQRPKKEWGLQKLRMLNSLITISPLHYLSNPLTVLCKYPSNMNVLSTANQCFENSEKICDRTGNIGCVSPTLNAINYHMAWLRRTNIYRAYVDKNGSWAKFSARHEGRCILYGEDKIIFIPKYFVNKIYFSMTKLHIQT